jgi:hypothetical protein
MATKICAKCKGSGIRTKCAACDGFGNNCKTYNCRCERCVCTFCHGTGESQSGQTSHNCRTCRGPGVVNIDGTPLARVA